MAKGRKKSQPNIEMVERIRSLVEKLNLNTNRLAGFLGIPQSTLDKRVRGEVDFCCADIVKILAHYPNVSAEWLLRGHGYMFNDQNQAQAINELQDEINGHLSIINKQKDEISDLNKELTKKLRQIDFLLEERIANK